MLSRTVSLQAKVAVLGACGSVGRVVSLLLRCSPAVKDLRLVDVDEGAKGVAEDLSHIEYASYYYGLSQLSQSSSSSSSSSSSPPVVASPPEGEALEEALASFHEKKVTGYAYEHIGAALQEVDIVLSAAGSGRHKDTKSFDKLFESNAKIALDIARAVGQHAPPNAFFGVTTSPLNFIIAVTAEALKSVDAYNPRLLFGMTSVNTARARCYYTRETGFRPGKSLSVVGGQSGLTIVPLFSRAHIDSTPVSAAGAVAGSTTTTTAAVKQAAATAQQPPALSPEVLELLTVRVNEAGGCITQYGQPSSFACAHACREWVESLVPVIEGRQDDTVVTAMVESPLFSGCPFFSSPVRVTRDGVAEVFPLPKLSPFEEDLLDRCLPDLEKNLHRGLDFFAKWKAEEEEQHQKEEV